MRVCILTDEIFPEFDPSPYMKDYEWEMVTMTEPIMDVVRSLAARNKYDVYLNLCEGFDNDGDGEQGYEGVDLVKAMEELNLPFTGADSRCYDPTREEMQAVADANGLGFAKGFQVKSLEQAERLVKNLYYPIMVKHPKSFGSTGMFKDSRADTIVQLQAVVKRVCNEFGAARMEEFIIGKEYNVLVVDNPDDFSNPVAYPPAELLFPPGEDFWHTDVKWNYDIPFDFKKVTEPELVTRLQDLAQKMYLAMGVTGYARCDIRMKEGGELYILEINPNGGIMFKPEEYGPADYMILYDSEGYKGFFDRVFQSAIIRQKLRSGESKVV